MPFAAAHPALAGALEARGYASLTPVQELVLQPDADGRDLLVSAQTGSGKTVAYGLAMAPTLLGDELRMPPPGPPIALVVAPTRELAMQVQSELIWLFQPTGARIATCIGGMDGVKEARSLHSGCHVVVGTPGRICDHIRRGALQLHTIRAVVLDEADEMLDLGFRDELTQILNATPEERRTLLFSATLARDIIALTKQFQHNALRIDTLVRNQPHADIEYRAVQVSPREVEHAIVNVLRFVESPSSLVFCATREKVRHLHASLLERGFPSVALSGELSQQERTRAVHAIRTGQARVCVATDVAARGLDLPDLGLVIHADLPTDKAILLHRSGRTGRAGRKGMCVLVVPHSRVRAAENLFRAAGLQPSWSDPPSPEDIRARDAERLLADPILTTPPTAEEQDLAETLLRGVTREQLATAFLRLHASRLPEAEETAPETAPPPPAPKPHPNDRAPHRPGPRHGAKKGAKGKPKKKVYR